LPPGAGAGPLIAGEGSALADGGEFAKAGLELDTSPRHSSPRQGPALRRGQRRYLEHGLWRLDAIAAALKPCPADPPRRGPQRGGGKAAGELELSITARQARDR